MQPLNLSTDNIFSPKPVTDYLKHGSWRRSRSQDSDGFLKSRSQDSDGFLKRQKDHSNMEIAQSVAVTPHQFRHSVEAVSKTDEVEAYSDNRVVEERETRQRRSLWNRRSTDRTSG